MHWGSYEVFSVISGIIVVLAALFVPGELPRDRFWGFIGGAVMIGYGVYVAKQTSGTFRFPAVIFVIPAVALLYLINAAVQHSRATGGSDR